MKHLALQTKIVKTWEKDGRSFYSVHCVIKNISNSIVSDARIIIDGKVQSIENVSVVNGAYSFPQSVVQQGLQPGAELAFAFVSSGEKPVVHVKGSSVTPAPASTRGGAPVRTLAAYSYSDPIDNTITGSLAATTVPSTLPAGTSPLPTMSTVNVKGGPYTREQFKRDLYLVLTAYPNSPSLIFWDDSGKYGMNFLDDMYYGIANAFFMFYADCGFDIAQFYRLVLCNCHKETTMNPFCAYSPGIMTYKTMASISPGIIQLSPAPQCLAFQAWAYPLTDWTGQRLVVPLPNSYNDTGSETKDISYMRLDDIATCFMMWGFIQRNTNNCSDGNSAFNNYYRQIGKGFTNQQLMYIWNTGNPNQDAPWNGNSGDYVRGIYLRWKNAGFSDDDWKTVTQVFVPGGPPLAMTWDTLNVSYSTFAANIAAASTSTTAPSSVPTRDNPNAQPPYGPSVSMETAAKYLPDLPACARNIAPLGKYDPKATLQYATGVGNLSGDGMGPGGGGSWTPPGDVINSLVAEIYPAGTQGSPDWWGQHNWSSIVAGS